VVYQLKFEQFIPNITLDKAWSFFSSPKNLKLITPPEMGFDIKSNYLDDLMYPGMIITYTVKPILGIPTEWVTEITHVKQNVYFIDEQRFGPYAMWNHKHTFIEKDGGILMIDLLNYKIPFGIFGQMANYLFVASKIKEIFDHRVKRVEEIFGK
jgi:ligand-binding SRPBCC domain-containing protein